MKKEIKLFVTDVEGVWTDKSIFSNINGDEYRKFNLSDSVGVLFLYLLNIPVVVVSEESNEIIKRRIQKLRINEYFLGATNKVAVVTDLLKKYNLEWDEVAFIGDDINDIKLLQKAGFSATPAQASYYVKKNADLVLLSKGGEGAFREFVEKYLDAQGMLEETVEKYLQINESFA